MKNTIHAKRVKALVSILIGAACVVALADAKFVNIGLISGNVIVLLVIIAEDAEFVKDMK